jgi:hypothetical protein
LQGYLSLLLIPRSLQRKKPSVAPSELKELSVIPFLNQKPM